MGCDMSFTRTAKKKPEGLIPRRMKIAVLKSTGLSKKIGLKGWN